MGVVKTQNFPPSYPKYRLNKIYFKHLSVNMFFHTFLLPKIFNLNFVLVLNNWYFNSNLIPKRKKNKNSFLLPEFIYFIFTILFSLRVSFFLFM